MLSEERKKEIIEEEKLREQLKSKAKSKKSSSCLILIVLIVVLFFVWLFSGSGSSNSDTNTQNDNGNVVNSRTATNSNENTSVVSSELKTYQLGEAFSVKSGATDYSKYNWDITKTSLTKLDNFRVTKSLTPRTLTPQNGKFYIISIEAVNRYTEKAYPDVDFTDDLILVDSNGKKYSRNNSEAESSYTVYFDKYPKVAVANPDEKTSLPVLYDVPEQTYKLCDENQKIFCIEGIK